VRKTFIILAVAGLIGAALYAFNKAQGTQLKWEDQKVGYQFRQQSQTSYSSRRNAGPDTIIDIEGYITVTVMEKDTSTVRLKADIHDVSARIDAIENRELSRRLTTVCTISVDTRGQLAQFQFNETMDEKSRSMVIGLFKHYEVILTDDNDVIYHNDSLGRYLARYNIDPQGNFTKRKIEYVSLSQQNKQPLTSLTASVLSSNTQFGLSKTFWLDFLEGEETIAFSETQQLFEVEQRFSLKRLTHPFEKQILESKNDPDSMLSKIPGNKNNTLLQPAPSIEQEIPDSDHVSTIESAASLSDFIDIITEMPDSIPIGDSDAIKLYLKNHPEIVLELPELIKTGQLADNKIGFLIAILGIIETPQSQESIMTILTDPNARANDRFRAAVASASVHYPTEDTINTLFDMTYAIDSMDDDSIAGSALMSLGTISSNLSEISSQKSQEINQWLLNRLFSTDIQKEKIYLLDALGNSSAKMSMNDIVPFLNDSSPNVQNASIDFLSHIVDPGSRNWLQERYPREQDPFLRRRVIKSMNKQNLEYHDLEQVYDWLLGEPNHGVRAQMYELLNDHLHEFPLTNDHIRNLFQVESSESNVKSIYRLKVNSDRLY